MPVRQFVYFHGQPGGPAELGLFEGGSEAVFTPDRGPAWPSLPLPAYLDQLALEIRARFPEGAIRLVGFSLGAFVALEVATRLAGRVSRIDLVSAAAPLETGDYLDQMAGKPVFQAARRSPWLLALLTWVQGRIAQIAPRRLIAQIFAGAQGQDILLRDDPAFVAGVSALFRRALTEGAHGYAREVRAYVQPWGEIAPKIASEVVLWHGDLDNWTPPAMAEALARRLPNARPVVRLPGLSHYSTLQAALPEIFRAPGPHASS